MAQTGRGCEGVWEGRRVPQWTCERISVWHGGEC